MQHAEPAAMECGIRTRRIELGGNLREKRR